jgi:O-acetyl-ADP-ribose deacetylase (regulator of RNase III)
LRAVYENTLRAAAKHGCRVIAVPAISTGAYRFPVKRGAEIALATVAGWLQDKRRPEVVRFVLLKETVFEAFRSALGRLAAGAGRSG